MISTFADIVTAYFMEICVDLGVYGGCLSSWQLPDNPHEFVLFEYLISDMSSLYNLIPHIQKYSALSSRDGLLV